MNQFQFIRSSELNVFPFLKLGIFGFPYSTLFLSAYSYNLLKSLKTYSNFLYYSLSLKSSSIVSYAPNAN